MPSYTYHVFSALKEADLVMEVVDARFPNIMRNEEVEQFLRARKVPIILVLNKIDLLHGKKPDLDWEALKKKDISAVGVSCAPKRNILRLRGMIYSKLKDGGKIAMFGYPNAGKSSLINALSGRHAAPTSSQAGFTRGRSHIRLREGVYLMDTPGIIPLDDRDEFLLMLFNARSPNQLHDIQDLAMQLLEWLPTHAYWSDWVFRSYGVKLVGDGEEQLGALALHWRKIRKGNAPDLHSAAVKLILDWQAGWKH